MTRDPDVKRVIAVLEPTVAMAKAALAAAEDVCTEAVGFAAEVEGASEDAWDAWTNGEVAVKVARRAEAKAKAANAAADRAHSAWSDAEGVRNAAADDLHAARKCKTLADLLTCDRSAVRLAAQLALAPTPTVAAPVARRRTR